MARTARYLGIVLFSVLPLLSLAGENQSALSALKALPKQEVQNLALIAAYGGTSDPERWHFVVYDPNTPSGVREYVVEGGELVTARAVSQFTDRVTNADVIGTRPLQIDSDWLAKLAKEYAAANGVALGKIGYQLLKTADTAEPVWRITCVDKAEKAVAALVVAATQGNVVSYEGFAVQPKIAQKPQTGRGRDSDDTNDNKRPGTKKSDSSEEAVAAAATRKKSTASTTKRSAERKSASDSQRSFSRRDYVRAPGPEVLPPVTERRPSNPIGGLFRKLFAR